jgi:hypothetical protein
MPRYDRQRYGRKRGGDNTTLKIIDYWHLNSDHSGTTFFKNWTNTLTSGGDVYTAHKGTAMSVSSTTGYWTFPRTGIYSISLSAWIYARNSDGDIIDIYHYLSADGGSTNNRLLKDRAYVEVEGYETVTTSQMTVDIPNVSTHLYAMGIVGAAGTNHVRGDSTLPNRTFAVFERIGDSINE